MYARKHVLLAGSAHDSGIRESRAQPLPPRTQVNVVPAVVLMPRLPVPDAAAVVLRRPNLWPANVILLREDSLSVGAFESAMLALLNDVARDGGAEAPSTTRLLPIHGQELPTAISKAGHDESRWMLDTLKHIPRRTVAGVGAYRAAMLRIGGSVGANGVEPDSR